MLSAEQAVSLNPTARADDQAKLVVAAFVGKQAVRADQDDAKGGEGAHRSLVHDGSIDFGVTWSTRAGERAGLTTAALLCAAFVGWLLLWAALDRRPPDDHDDFYTHRSIPAAWAAAEAGPVGKVGVYVRHFREGRLHPQLAQTSLVAAMGSFGVSRFVFRAANAPWLFLLLFGTFLLARELTGPRLAFLAVFLVGTLPIVLNYSRKWDIQFHAACLVPFGLWLGLRALQSGGRWWAGFAVWQGLRFYSHPILVRIAVTVGLVGLAQLGPALWARDVEACVDGYGRFSVSVWAWRHWAFGTRASWAASSASRITRCASMFSVDIRIRKGRGSRRLVGRHRAAGRTIGRRSGCI